MRRSVCEGLSDARCSSWRTVPPSGLEEAPAAASFPPPRELLAPPPPLPRASPTDRSCSREPAPSPLPDLALCPLPRCPACCRLARRQSQVNFRSGIHGCRGFPSGGLSAEASWSPRQIDCRENFGKAGGLAQRRWVSEAFRERPVPLPRPVVQAEPHAGPTRVAWRGTVGVAWGLGGHTKAEP